MMLVKTFLKASPIHGIGIFATENIAKGTTIWKFNSLIDKRITSEEMDVLPQLTKEYLLKYAYVNRKGELILCGDDARFFNHSEEPTCYDNDSESEEDITIAARDIKKGEEITSNYKSFDHSQEAKLSI